jgi:hypothetical protein
VTDAVAAIQRGLTGICDGRATRNATGPAAVRRAVAGLEGQDRQQQMWGRSRLLRARLPGAKDEGDRSVCFFGGYGRQAG